MTETINPVRLSQEFQGRVANPRDVFVFHRAKQSRGSKVVMEKPELSIDDPDLTIQEKLHKVRMHTLVQEYLSAQQVQVLAEPGMSDALETYMNKDDIHSFETCVRADSLMMLCIDITWVDRHYRNVLKGMQKGVQVDVPEDDVQEDNLDELVSMLPNSVQRKRSINMIKVEKAREKMEEEFAKKHQGERTNGKVRPRSYDVSLIP